jgi:hypothetical protein
MSYEEEDTCHSRPFLPLRVCECLYLCVRARMCACACVCMCVYVCVCDPIA